VTLSGSTNTGANGCLSPLYKFWTQVPGGTTWTVLQDWSTNANAACNTAGLSLGQYNLNVWVRNASSSPNGWDAAATMTYVLGSTSGCTAASLTATALAARRIAITSWRYRV